MPPSASVQLLIGRVAGAVGLIDAYAARATPEEAFSVSDVERNEAGDPACEVDAASPLGAEAG